jgi:cysteine desulfurase
MTDETSNRVVYLDHHSTTPCDPRVIEAMLPFFGERFGNAASKSHAFGWTARAAVDRAREAVAALIGAAPEEMVFTSGATESDNLALKGAAAALADRGRHVVTTAIEHRAVLDSCKYLEAVGFAVTRVPVGSDGLVDPEAIRAALTRETVLVSVMLANNEVGTVQPLAEIGRLTSERGIAFHTDAVQGVGRTDFDVERMGVDLASLSAHKIYGPKGIGALYVRAKGRRLRIAAQMDGGGHERGMRSGTLNVPAIVGFGKACEILAAEAASENARIGGLRDRLQAALTSGLAAVHVNGRADQRVPGNLNLGFEGVEADTVMAELRDVAMSSGSACSSATAEPSHVLAAMGIPDAWAKGSLRFGLGRFNDETEIDHAARRVIDVVTALRSAAGWSPAR